MTFVFDSLRSTKPFAAPPRAIVWHHTGGIGDHRQVIHTLLSRKGPHSRDGKSVHYVIDADGHVEQTASLDRSCLHAGVANPWSIGIEFVSPGFPGSLADREVLRGDEVRVRVPTSIHQHTVAMLDFTRAQYESGLRLADELTNTLGIARRVPVDASGRLITRELDAREIADCHGVIGHYHVHPRKRDCGTRPLETLMKHWGLT